MTIRFFKLLGVSLACLALGAAGARAAAFVSDFNNGIPPGTSLMNSSASIGTSGGIGNSGVLKLSTPGGAGTFIINNFTAGNAITNFRMTYRFALGGGTCCGNRMADGLAFAFGNDLPATWSEDGAGTGLIVGFDTWDNAAPDTAPAIDLKVGGNTDGNVVAFQSFTTLAGALREGGRPADGPVLTDGDGQEVNIFTVGPAPAVPTDATFIDVYMELFPDNTFSLSYSNLVIFNRQPITYTPIENASFGWSARIGGANENAWIDDLQIFANFTAGPVSILEQPVAQTVTESQTATFSVGVDGTPPYSAQWFSNGVAIAGATLLNYTTSTTTNMNGTVYTVAVSNELSAVAVLSEPAVLTVNAGAFVSSVSSEGNPNAVRVLFSKPVSLSGTYTIDNGVTVNSAAYGGSHREVVLSTTVLTPDTTYTLTVNNELGEDSSGLVPNPSVVSFFHGFGAICTDFTALPDGAVLFNNGITGSGVLGDDGTGNTVVHLTDDGNNGAYGKLFISNRTGGAVLKDLQANWRSRIGGELGVHADGMSFNWADNLAANGNFVATEEGEGSGVSFVIDTWDNGSGPDTGIEIKWQATRIAFQHIPRTDEGDGNFICKDVFVDASASVDAYGRATFTYDGNTISATIPAWGGIVNGAFVFSGRTGGENDNFWIDDVCINNFTVGPISFTSEPVTTTALEGQPATLTAAVDGSPTYYFQWRTNGVPVPGATNSTYTTPATTAAFEGLQVSVVASNTFSSVTSSNAILHVLLSPRIVSVSSAQDNEVHVVWTRAVDLNSGTYDFDNGVFENSRAYGASHREVVIITDSLTVNTTYALTVTDVAEELVPGNVQFPNPTIATFHHGYGSVTADFEAGLPAGATTIGTAAVLDGFLHLTDAVNSQGGVFFLPDINGGFPADRLLIRFKTQIGGGTCCGAGRWADGMSFNVASDLTSTANYGEEGAGTGLTITFDTWDNDGVDTAPALEVRYKNITVATQAMAGIREGTRTPVTPLKPDGNDNPLSLDTSNQFANVLISIAPDGKLDLYFKDVLIFQNVQLPNYTPFVNANFGFGARTGGANENAWIDDLSINAFSLGGVTITRQPDDVTTAARASFNVDVDGLPPYFVQWYSNSVPVAGATALSYITPVLDQSAAGAGYSAVISNAYNSVTSRVAVVTFTGTSAALSIVRNTDGSATITWPGTGWTLQATPMLNPNPALTVWENQPFTSPTVIPPGFFGTGATNVFFRLSR